MSELWPRGVGARAVDVKRTNSRYRPAAQEKITKAPLYCPFPGCKVQHPRSVQAFREWIVQHSGRDHLCEVNAKTREEAQAKWRAWVALSNPKHGA